MERLIRILIVFVVPAGLACNAGTTAFNGISDEKTIVTTSMESQAEISFFAGEQLDSKIPTPESVVGHGIEEGAVRYNLLIDYLQKLTEVSDRVILTPYGTSHEGRTLYYLTITSPANHKRLSKIKADNRKLADPRKLKDSTEREKILDNLPGIAWMAYSIHGDELSSTDAAMYIAYRLAAGADKATGKMLDELVIHIDPLMNPDGRERYLGQLQQLTGVVSSSDYQSLQHRGLWSQGRGNHYLFDMNRDWVILAHSETQARVRAILSWQPQLLVDSHEMGGYDTYMFDPPREPTNTYHSETLMNWRKRFSNDHAAAFNQYGWSYYTRDWYSDWGPIYTNSWANLLGTVGILYEQAQANAAAVKQPTGIETTFEESVHHQIVSSLTNLETLRANRKELLTDFLEDREWAVSDRGPDTDIFLLPPSCDKQRWNRLVEVLRDQGFEFAFARKEFQIQDAVDIWGTDFDKKTLPEGTLIARSQQPLRRMLYTLLGFDPKFTDETLRKEREDLEKHRGSRLYDVTSWNLAMSFGLEAYWAEAIEDVAVQPKPPEDASKALVSEADKNYGYLIDFSTSQIYPLLVSLWENDCHPRIAAKPFKIGGRDWSRGTVLLRGHENPDNLAEVLQKVGEDFDVDIVPTKTALTEKEPDLGGRHFHLLTEPRVAVASQWPIYTTSFGSVWYLLDYRVRLRVSPVNIQSIAGGMDLRKYNVLILPQSRGLSGILDSSSLENIESWVENGGTLIAVGSSAAFLTDKDRGLSQVRLKRDVLDELSIYDEGVQREKSSRDIQIDPVEVWSGKKVDSESDTAQKCDEELKDDRKEKPDSKGDLDKLKRDDAWQRIFKAEGTFVKAVLDPEQWLAFGLGEQLPVMISGSSTFMSKYPVSTPARLSEPEDLRLSGLLWPEARQRWADTAYATVERKGEGQIILFGYDPTFRSWLPGAERLFLNAVMLGPGMGTSPPSPW
jgi:hypothetical protein